MTAVWNGFGQRDFEMKYYLAPLEGITGYIFRNTLREVFGDVDKCFTPFIAPNENRPMNTRERTDVLPEHNEGIFLVPQILTNRVDHFLITAREIAEMGYEEINLNLGCPSGTVTAKGKGAALLGNLDALRRLLDGIFTAAPVCVSVKTRLGMKEPEEFWPVLEIYNDYPISELIIHPRTRTEMYDGKVHLDVFSAALEKSRVPVCYNGDILTAQDIAALTAQFPQVSALMIGRGLVGDPTLVVRAGGASVDVQTVRQFHDELCDAYCAAFGGPTNALQRMKAIWDYMLRSFDGGAAYKKRLVKTRNWADYMAMTGEMFTALKPVERASSSQFEAEY